MSDQPSIIDNVDPSAEYKRTHTPHIAPPRLCKVCSAPAAAGAYWCRDCRGLL